MRIEAKRTGELGIFIISVALGALATMNAAFATPKSGAVFRDWVIECDSSDAAGSTSCAASQTQRSKAGGKLLIKVSVGYFGPKSELTMISVVPLGISLVAGVAYKVDNGAPVKLAPQTCTADGCSAALSLDARRGRELLGGKSMLVGYVMNGSTETNAVRVSLDGLKAAVASLR